jgi:hypothetical protein
MSLDKQKEKQTAVYCYEQRLLMHIRSVKLVREIGNGTQRRLTQWVS